MNGATNTAEPEPIVLEFSDGPRHTLTADLTSRIWKEVERGHYSGPEELIGQAMDVLFGTTPDPAI